MYFHRWHNFCFSKIPKNFPEQNIPYLSSTKVGKWQWKCAIYSISPKTTNLHFPMLFQQETNCANFHLMSLFIELSLEKYSRPVDLSVWNFSKVLHLIFKDLCPLKPPLGGSQHSPNPHLYLWNSRKLNLFDKTVVILSA